jgi:short-subunit dehydrogenase
VFISSLAGIRGLPLLSAYGASKMALRGIAESIRIEEAKHGIHVGLIYVAMTEIAHNKEAIGADGAMVVLETRKNRKVQSTEFVARAVAKNIRQRKFITTLSGLGKLNSFLQSRFPSLVERIILMNMKKFEEGSK